jgi:hypothetical protein
VMLPLRNSALSVPPDFHNSGSRVALLASVESQRNLHPLPPPGFPAARSIAERMPNLEQQLAFFIKDEQRRTLPSTSEQQLASFTEAQPGRSGSFQHSRSVPSDRALTFEHELASLTEQHPGRSQPFLAAKNALDMVPTVEQLLASLSDEQLASLNDAQQRRSGSFLATKNAPDMVPTIEQLLASLSDEQLASLNDEQQRRRGSFQDTSSLQNSKSTIEEHLASSIEHQQGYHGSLQDRMPTIEQQVASLVQAADFTSPLSCFPSNLQTKYQPPLLPSLEHLQLLRQLQRDVVPHARQGGCDFANAHGGHIVGPRSSKVPRELPIPVPPPYGTQEPFPGKLYRLLAEAESNGNDNIISFTQDGCAFKIHSRENFIKKVSPTYFRQAKITSFVRQLNFYGFEKLLEGPNRGGFANRYFRRGYPELLLKIERVSPRSKGSGGAVA